MWNRASIKFIMNKCSAAVGVLRRQNHDTTKLRGFCAAIPAPEAVASNLADFFGRNCGVIGAQVASFSGGYQPLADRHNPHLPGRAHALGKKLVSAIQLPAWRTLTPKYLWIEFLRRVLLRRLVLRNAVQFTGIIEIWKERGLLA